MLGDAHAEIVKLVGGNETRGCWHSEPDSVHSNEQLWPFTSVPWRSADHPELSAWLDENEQALKIVAGAAGRDRFWIPLVPETADTSFCFTQDPEPFDGAALQIAESLQYRAMRSIGAGDLTGAWRNLLVAHRICHLLAGQAAFPNAWIGVDYDRRTQEADRALLKAASHDKPLLLQVLKDFQSLSPLPSRDELFRRKSRYDFADGVQELSRKASPALLKQPIRIITAPDWNRVLRDGNAFIAKYFLADHDWKSPAERGAFFDQFDAEIKRLQVIGGDSTSSTGDPRILESSSAFTARFTARVICLLTPALVDRPAPIMYAKLITLACALEIYRLDHSNT